MTAEQALTRLAASTSESIIEVLTTLAGPNSITPGGVTVVPEGADPLEDVELPCVTTDVSYVDGVQGGNLMILPVAVAKSLAGAMGAKPGGGDDGELSELELSAVGEAMNQMMSSAATATGSFLGEAVDIAPPRTRLLTDVAELREIVGGAVHIACSDFTLFGADCRVVQLVPNAFVVRMTRALDTFEDEDHDGEPLRDTLRDIPVRVWAELGRVRMPMASFVALPPGEAVELDREAEEPIDLYVDGMRFGGGRLVITEEGELAVRIEEVA